MRSTERGTKKRTTKKSPLRFNNWLVAVVAVFSLSVILKKIDIDYDVDVDVVIVIFSSVFVKSHSDDIPSEGLFRVSD